MRKKWWASGPLLAMVMGFGACTDDPVMQNNGGSDLGHDLGVAEDMPSTTPSDMMAPEDMPTNPPADMGQDMGPEDMPDDMAQPDPTEDFVFTVTFVTDSPSGFQGARYSLGPAGRSPFAFDFDVDWGDDGVFDLEGVTNEVGFEYMTAGPHTIRVRGQLPHEPDLCAATSLGVGEVLAQIDVKRWGGIEWSSMERMFAGCEGLVISAKDGPKLAVRPQGVDMTEMFKNAVDFDSPIGTWDTSQATDMRLMFENAGAFNQPIGDWDVSRVTDMTEMFSGAERFDQDLSDWDTSSVITTSGMFFIATSFDKPIGDWDTSAVTDMSNMFLGAVSFNQPIGTWDTSQVTTMNGLFDNATSFNQPIGGWNTARVQDMSEMFFENPVFDQDISGWNTSAVTTMEAMFFGADAFNQNLSGWDVRMVAPDARFERPMSMDPSFMPVWAP